MLTIWGEKLDKDHILQEYPRPQLKRDSYLNLNGQWEFSMGAPTQNPLYEQTILVPFSPECELSQVNQKKQPGERLYYRRYFTLPEGFFKGRLLLHFGAVDYRCWVKVNGEEVGSHEGGYWPFTLDITSLYKEGQENILTVEVEDEAPTAMTGAYGKQSETPGGIWYTAQSGIWQTVWLESVPKVYITGLTITPYPDKEEAVLTIHTNGDMACRVELEGMTYAAAPETPIHLPVEQVRLWSPDDPYLYPFTVEGGEDRVESYFALRSFTVEEDGEGIPRLCLNHKPFFFTGVLDQGYWSDGLYTPASDEAMVCDIQTMKAMGFNTLRKHTKIEPLRWYYHCDRMGMVVWQDMVSGGGPYKKPVIQWPLMGWPQRVDDGYAAFGREEKSSRDLYYKELQWTVELLYNCPCIALWTPFNEGWGQFDALKVEKRLRKLDNTRLIDHASGWHDQGGGDVYSRHVYYRPYGFRPDPEGKRACVLTEFGGYTLGIPGHRYTEEKVYSYKKLDTEESFTAAFKKLYQRQILPAKREGLCAAIYTQLSDIESEINGLLTYDRRVLKIDPEVVRTINDRLTEEFAPAVR